MSILKRLGVPVFNAEGTSPEDVEDLHLEVGGLVGPPRTFSLDEVRAMPLTVVNARLTSVSGWSVRADWGGVLWSDFERQVPAPSHATHATFSSPSGYDTTVRLEELRTPPGAPGLAGRRGGDRVRVWRPAADGGPSTLGLQELQVAGEN